MQSGKIVIATSSFQIQSLVLMKMIKEIKNEKKIKIGNKVLGEKQPLFITAEIGITCNYDINITKELIDVTKEAGADAIKLIFWFPEEIMSDKTISYSYETTKGKVSENMFEMLNKLRFTLDEWYEIKEHADKQGIIIFSTVNSPSGIEYAEAIDLDAYKLSSWDYNYFPLWKQISKLNKPMIIDTGPVNTLEVAKVKRSENGVISDPVTLSPEDSVEKALVLMEKQNVSGFPVTLDGSGHGEQGESGKETDRVTGDGEW